MNQADLSANQIETASPPAPVSRVSSRAWRRWVDSSARVVITLGGWATIVSIFGIFAYLFIEVAPLFDAASWTESASVHLASVDAAEPETVAVGIDEYMEVGYVLRKSDIAFYALPAGTPVPLDPSVLSGAERSRRMPDFEDGEITALARSPGKTHTYGLGTKTGRVIPFYVSFRVTFDDDVRNVEPVVSSGEPFEAVPTPVGPEPFDYAQDRRRGAKSKDAHIARLAYRETDSGPIAAALTGSGRLFLTKMQESEAGGLFALETETEFLQVEVIDEGVAALSVLLLDDLGETLLGGTKDGRLLYWDIQDIRNPRLMGMYSAGTAITALSYLIGDRSIVIGTERGTVSVWMSVIDPDVGGDPRLQKIRDFASHDGAVTAISPSLRDKGFLTTGASGGVAVHHSTSGQTLIQIPGNGAAIRAAMFAPKTDGAVVLDDSGRLIAYDIENEHPESTFSSLFFPVLYEGYEEPHHIWQSTGGSDAFEPKFGLWPIMFGTVKGTIYAMLLATPLAVLGAIYTAMFMRPNIRAVVKPVVETMAAFPTVVLGFLAGLWFAPLLEQIFPAVVAMFLLLPLAVALVCIGWQFLPSRLKGQSGNVTELVAFVLVLVGTVWFCLQLNHQIETWLFDSDYKGWLQSSFGLAYDQRNALVIAFAMGMAVIPTIFSISEDSLSNVPPHLIAGSLALGATPWQTLTKLVIISASPGVFSALMIGLGRVVGETMIVLMATGNTPVMDMNLFNGFRTLSANIAVEMPEAPHGGTLYRLLFLAGLLLFVFTSIVNTLAEIVRQRLRARYSQF
ncbi:MAG: ABC transporter permease subunit [Nitrospira sp. SB0672_bin_25]|nr:ABC transporter permease subunit [Nitrospira sp. SB0666_bin_27]MYF25053.1 ABC transporter permease subunit [Nitrospira sp. SB0678_bin_10]MYJ54057.1 ABC transporter permease subunit [Nitrospira sp. SB0672_bin_25]